MKYFLYGGILAIVGMVTGGQIGLIFAPRYRLALDGTERWVCGNEFMEPGIAIGAVVGLLLGLCLAYRSPRRPTPKT